MGYLLAVRHLVGVVNLRMPCYKEWLSPEFETQQFGTHSRPGQVWRALTGQYIGYMADKEGVSAFMSTEHGLASVLQRIQLEPIRMEPDDSSFGTWLSYTNPDGKRRSARGQFLQVTKDLDLATVQKAVVPVKSIGRVNASSASMTITWESSFQRFHDIERVSRELGVISVKSLAGRFAGFRDLFSEIPDRELVPMAMSITLDKGRADVIL